MKLFGVIALVAVLVPLSTPVANAWECESGYTDTYENQKAGRCVEVKPPKKHYPKPSSPTPIPTTTISTPTPLPVAPTPLPSPSIVTPPVATATALPVPPVSLKPFSETGQQAQSPGQVCVKEGDHWFIRNNHFGDTLEAHQRWPLKPDICEQEREVLPISVSAAPVPPTREPTPTVAAAIIPPAVTVVIVETPAPVALVPACIYSDELVPLLDDEGNQMFVDDLPAWLLGDEVMVGELCPVHPKPEVPTPDEQPVVPVQLP